MSTLVQELFDVIDMATATKPLGVGPQGVPVASADVTVLGRPQGTFFEALSLGKLHIETRHGRPPCSTACGTSSRCEEAWAPERARSDLTG